MGRRLTALALFACLLLLAVGCGSSDSSTTSGSDTTAATAETEGGGSKAGSNGGGSKNASNGGSQSNESGGSGAAGGEPIPKSFSSTPAPAAEFKAPKGGDNSIQTFGEQVEGDEEEAVLKAMHAFLVALASSDYKGICEGITQGSVEQLEAYLKAQKETGSCETVLGKILTGQTSEARRAAAGKVYQVRIEGENAFVLFTPEGGTASYFVMKKENGEWKSTSIAAGVPFDPLAQAHKEEQTAH